MKIYMYIDESGAIHCNNRTRYFAVGGYFTLENSKLKITSRYKRFNHRIKNERSFVGELKSYHFSNDEKIMIFRKIQDIDDFYGLAMVFDKDKISKKIVQSKMFFNYAIKLLIINLILPLYDERNIDFIISIDDQNIAHRDLSNLEKYLKTEFCLFDFNFEIRYYDSKDNYGVQLADLIINTVYSYVKNGDKARRVFEVLDNGKFLLDFYPQ